jgi:ABC-type sugar transport system ATPase subunit
MRDLQIKARSPRQHVSELSGGNQQKVVLAKMLAVRRTCC